MWAGDPTLTEETFMVWDGEWDITLDVFRDLGIAFAAVLRTRLLGAEIPRIGQ
jgi:hypothetical protein